MTRTIVRTIAAAALFSGIAASPALAGEAFLSHLIRKTVISKH